MPNNNNNKKFKAEINLEDIGVIDKKGLPMKCKMLKGDAVECRFVVGGGAKNNNNHNVR